MSLKIEGAYIEPHIIKEKRSTSRFHTTMNFWNIMNDKGSKASKEKKMNQIQRIRNQNDRGLLNG